MVEEDTVAVEVHSPVGAARVVAASGAAALVGADNGSTVAGDSAVVDSSFVAVAAVSARAVEAGAADEITAGEDATGTIEAVTMAAGGADITARLTTVASLTDPIIVLTAITTIGDTGTRTPAATPLVTNLDQWGAVEPIGIVNDPTVLEPRSNTTTLNLLTSLSSATSSAISIPSFSTLSRSEALKWRSRGATAECII